MPRKGQRQPRPNLICAKCSKSFQPLFPSVTPKYCSHRCANIVARSKRTMFSLLHWKKPRVPELKDWEKGYAAGLIDGEGSISMAYDKGGKKVTPHLRQSIYITNTNLAIINQFSDIIKIKPSLKPRSARHLGYKPTYIFQFQNMIDVKFLLEQVLPYLAGKKRQAELALKFINFKLNKDSSIGITKEEINMYEEMKRLNGE